MSNNFDAALKTGVYTVDVEAGPVMGTPAQGYQQPQTYQAGYPVQAGYPTQGAYGSVHPFPVPYGDQSYPYPPPPIGGGSDDEKFQISDVGMCTVVPGLEKRNIRLEYTIIMSVFVGLALSMLIVGGVLLAVLKDKGPGISIGVTGLIGVAFVLFMHIIMRMYQPKNYDRITEEAIAEYIERITKLQATLNQINAVKSLMSQANPNTPHVFQVWKARLYASSDNHRGLVVSANFGTRNLPKGQKPQVHLYALR